MRYTNFRTCNHRGICCLFAWMRVTISWLSVWSFSKVWFSAIFSISSWLVWIILLVEYHPDKKKKRSIQYWQIIIIITIFVILYKATQRETTHTKMYIKQIFTYKHRLIIISYFSCFCDLKIYLAHWLSKAFSDGFMITMYETKRLIAMHTITDCVAHPFFKLSTIGLSVEDPNTPYPAIIIGR